MTLPENVVVATTTCSKDYDLRAKLAVKLISAARWKGHPVVVVDCGSHPRFVRDIQAGIVLSQKLPGMAESRRQALQFFEREMRQPAVILTEPEKYPLVDEFLRLAYPIVSGEADITVPDRGPLDSYPELQRHAENFGNGFFHEATGCKLDVWSGPRGIGRRALPLFTGYDCQQYGGMWDFNFIPVVRAIALEMRVVGVPVNYVHPPEQTVAEEGDPETTWKRFVQLQNLIPAIREEAARLGLPRCS